MTDKPQNINGILIESPQAEERRLIELYSLKLVDTDPEASFDRITNLVAHVFKTPICLVTLVTEDRQWFKSCFGLTGDMEQVRSTERQVAFCQHVVAHHQSLVVNDALLDPRFSSNQLVLQHGIRFYAGAPLTTKSGNVLGALCIIDGVPRDFSTEEIALLESFSKMVMTEIELHEEVRKHKRIQKELKRTHETNRYLAEALRYAGTGVVISDARKPGSPIVFVNQAFTDKTGYEAHEVLGQSHRTMLHGTDANQDALETVNKALANKQSTSIVYKKFRKNGEMFWDSVTVSPTLDQDGNIQHIVAVQNEVTELKRISEALERATEQYETVVNNLKEVIFQTDAEGHWMFLNPAWTEITGFSIEESLDQSYLDFVHPEDRTPTALRFPDMIKNKSKIENHRIRYLTKDGGYRWFEVYAWCSLDSDGLVIGSSGTLMDVTAQVEAMQKVTDTLTEFQNVVDTVPDFMYTFDAEGRLIRWNKALQDFMGLSDDEMLYHSVSDVLLNVDKNSFSRVVNQIFERGHIELEKTLTGRDGVTRPTQWSAAVLRDSKGETIGITGIGKDISERIQIRRDVELASKLQTELLPKNIDNERIKMTGLYMPSNVISGDFYDYTWLSEDVLYGYMVDVMGHGVATALQVSAMRLLFQQASDMKISVSEKLAWINKSCLSIIPEEYYATGICFEINFKEQTLTYAVAGINRFYAFTEEHQGEVKVPGAFLGIYEDMEFDEHCIPIRTGDRIVFVTDGFSDVWKVGTYDTSFSSLVNQLQFLMHSGRCSDDATAMCFEIK